MNFSVYSAQIGHLPILTFGYHLVGCKVDAHAIRLHDNVVHKLVVLLRSLGLVVSLEPISLLTDIISDDNRRPDIFICNPYGGVI